jgi:hypothetical protein
VLREREREKDFEVFKRKEVILLFSVERARKFCCANPVSEQAKLFEASRTYKLFE